jgi:4-hydroxybenzoate polyprenyltransferase
VIDQHLVQESNAEAADAAWTDYVALARPGHWVKHIFILPGIVLAELLRGHSLLDSAGAIALGLLSAGLIASANYVLNEWLDAASDAFHPTKSHRPAVAKRLSPGLVRTEYLALAAFGLLLAALVSTLFLIVSGVFLLSGWIYNVRPVRAKDVPYVDVLTESVNNPIRLTLGWAMLETSTLPPGSLLGGYWMGGAFLMAVKRLAEYRAAATAGALDVLGQYRKSFGRYTESSLLTSALVYSMLSGFFVAVFFVKYRIEYLLALPVLAALFGTYLSVGLKRHSTAQTPERLIRETALVLVVALLVAALIALTLIDLPILDRLTDPHYIELPFGT